ncbi:MAG: hypothetical protein COX48_02285 [bacterium (Candidatus Stahlbacteria) CG23_combo_of_CG06-09_8_20_14_all_34_7]|nr:MAG: hypothetical protein COX48_02285 [bacterium (Candidatus Stahlbacteria) CG23_combo_of_CG06-09_8_20_14_all_34_7]
MLYLRMKCPYCGSSLMDENKLIDGKPSLKLKMKYNGNEFFGWLSGMYGSYKHEEEMNIPKSEIVQFFCPECGKELLTEAHCDKCDAHMVSILLEEGGKVRFCSRNGCSNHYIEFKKAEVALKLLYEAYSYEGSIHEDIGEKIRSSAYYDDIEKKEIIRNGTFLFTYCPHCQKSLIKGNEIELEITNSKGEKGTLHLSPYLNVFKHRSTIRLEVGEEIEDINCPHCKKSIVIDDKCPECGSKTAKILVTSSVKLVDFRFCTKPGCKWHGISDLDESIIMLEDSKEW